MDLNWKRLIDLRERQRLQALEQVSRDRERAAASRAQAQQAADELQRCVQAQAGHWQATRGALQEGGVNVAQLRQATQWGGALDRQIAQADGRLLQAQTVSAQDARQLDASRQKLRGAAAGIEKAKTMQQRDAAQAQRQAEVRADERSEELATQAWARRRV